MRHIRVALGHLCKLNGIYFAAPKKVLHNFLFFSIDHVRSFILLFLIKYWINSVYFTLAYCILFAKIKSDNDLLNLFTKVNETHVFNLYCNETKPFMIWYITSYTKLSFEIEWIHSAMIFLSWMLLLPTLPKEEEKKIKITLKLLLYERYVCAMQK